MPVIPIKNDWSQRYIFREILAQGGMGIIYLADDKEQNNHCVIKQMIIRSANPEEHQESVRLFKREAEVLKLLHHPGIVHLRDSHATEDGHYFLVMDRVPGKSLAELLQAKKTFSSQATIEIAIQCCEVLEYLHKHNPPIIYRDLKPSNLMLTPDGHIVFIDFGVARALLPQNLTATRVVTTGYSAPEQYSGKPEFRSDLYSLGATMYQLLTGSKPRPLTTSSPLRGNAGVLPSLDNLVQRLTASEAADRPLSAQYVRYELYHIYKEIDPGFIIPEEARLIDWQTDRRQKPQLSKSPLFKRLWQSFFNI